MPATATRGDQIRLEVSSVEVRSLAAVGTLAGVRVIAAAGRCGPGTGRLRSSGDGTRIAWREPGSAAFGNAVLCGSDGEYLLEGGADPDAWVRIEVYTAYLTPGPAEAAVYLADVYGSELVSDVDANDAGGAVHTWTIEIHNDGDAAVEDLRAWFDATAFSDLATAAVDVEMAATADPGDRVAPTAEDHADVLIWDSLAAGASVNLYLVKTMGPTPSAAKLLYMLRLSWLGMLR